MKTLVLKSTICLVIWLNSAMAFCGSEGVGGGDAVVLPNDQVILADPYVKKEGKSAGAFHPLLIIELMRIDRLLQMYGGFFSFLNKAVLEPHVQFRFVTEIPDIAACKNRIPVGNLPSNSQLEQVACTEGHLTWIKEDLFKKLSIRGQALLIVHERLRGLPVTVAGEEIADITNGLEFALALLNGQNSGLRPILSSAQMNTLNTLFDRVSGIVQQYPAAAQKIALFGKYSITMSNTKLSPNGGGLVSIFAKVAKSAYIGVGSAVGVDSTVGNAAELVNAGASCLVNICALSAQSQIIDSWILGNEYYGDEDRKPPVIALGFQSKIQDSSLLIGENGIHLGLGSKILSSNIKSADEITLNAGSRLESVLLWNEGSIRMEKNSSLSNAQNLQVSVNSNSFTLSELIGRRTVVGVKAESNIDFQNKFICYDGTNDFLLSANASLLARSIDDFAGHCERKNR